MIMPSSDIERDAERVLRQASAAHDTPLLAEYLLRNGWAVFVDPPGDDGTQRLRAAKDAGAPDGSGVRLYCPGGHANQWSPVLRGVRLDDSAPRGDDGPDWSEHTEWRIVFSQAVPVATLATVATAVAAAQSCGGPGLTPGQPT